MLSRTAAPLGFLRIFKCFPTVDAPAFLVAVRGQIGVVSERPGNEIEEPSQARQRGRGAESPKDIPAQGWRDIAVRVKRETAQDNISIVAAGVAYYGFLAIFPALAAVVLVFGLFADPSAVQRHVSSLSSIPEGVRQMVGQELGNLTRQSGGSLSLGVVISILVALWSSTKGVKALIESLNIAYDEKEQRGFFHRTGITVLFTIGIIAFAAFA